MKIKLLTALLWGAFSFCHSACAITINNADLNTGESLTILDTTDGQMAFTKVEATNIDNLKKHTVIVMRIETEGEYRGAGIAIDKRHILTVNHITSATGKNFYLEHEGSQPFWATIVKQDALHDIALLEIDKNAPDLIVEPMAFADNITLDEPVYTVGHPKGILYSLTHGAVSSLEGKGSDDIKGVELNMRIKNGNSGGFVINGKGEIVGMMFSSQDMIGNMAFMINLKDIQAFLKEAT